MKENIIKYKKLTISIIMIMLVIVFGGSSTYAANQISIFIDGEELYTDVPPIIIDSKTMVPLRAVSEAVGCKVDWFKEDKRIVVYSPVGGDPLLVMSVNDPKVTVNHYNGDTGEVTGEVVTIEAPPVIIEGKTMIPLRFIAETIGFRVEWDGTSRTVFLFSAAYDDDLKSKKDTREGQFPDGIIYSEEYSIEGDPGDGLSSGEAAMLLTRDKITSLYDNISTQEPVNITLVDLKFVNGEECYIFEVKKAPYTSSRYAVGLTGNIYEDFL
ncbi:copper amine oxidase N-terminal domain-containing protein [Anaerovorax odorimutans]|uniref:copper amine oxidase N-terminal domain-containing protein n=1 Tax=Anaerovorax odorimutans TaxID=109327 RepID=UPI000408AE98|nr:copper amine oxidase N-terminal domain-containing protein [Anaerovorax odorimutans]